ncbi:hypothetical protein D3C87_2098110 [compost metagenome]
MTQFQYCSLHTSQLCSETLAQLGTVYISSQFDKVLDFVDGSDGLAVQFEFDVLLEGVDIINELLV